VLRQQFDALIDEPTLSTEARDRLFESVADELIGYGPLTSLLADNEISEILVTGPKQVYVIRNGKLESSVAEFDDSNHVLRILDRIYLYCAGLTPTGLPDRGTIESPNGWLVHFISEISGGAPIVVIHKMPGLNKRSSDE